VRLILAIFIFVSFSFSKEFCISNFKKEICDNFKIANGIIIKSKLKKEEIKRALKLDSINQIAFLKSSNIYLVDTNTPIKDYEQLKKLDFIEYVIPDIIQRKKRANFDIHRYQKSLNLNTYWSKTKGEGINIAIIDDGFDLQSEEFSDTHAVFSYDVDSKTLNSSPQRKYDNHGTKVAGVIFGKHNGNEVEGIAPNANLIAIRQTTNKTSDTILAFSVAQKAGAHIINCSWNSPFLLKIISDIIKDTVLKNIVVVFAAGNESKEIKALSIEASIPEVVTVGATQKFSNYGEFIDFRLDSRVMSVGKNGSLVMFGGTSATAPMISGLIALKLAENKRVSIEEIIENLKKELKYKQKRL